MGKAFLRTIFPLFFTACLSAQPAALDLSAIGPQDGLEGGFNYHLQRDSRGFLWISSVNGVFRSDGLHVKSWTSEDGLLDNIVQSNFYEDAAGDIWFTTYNGINHYRRASDDFRSFQITSEQGDTIKEDYYFIHLEKGKALWFRAGAWLCRYDIASQQAARLATTAGVSFGVDTAANGSLERIYGCPWMNAGGFEFFNVGPSLKLERKDFLQNGTDGKRIEIVNSLVEHDTLAWLFSNQGLLAFNPHSPTTYQLYSLPGKGNTLLRNGVFYGHSYILALTKSNGPCFFDRKTRKFHPITDVPIGFHLKLEDYHTVMLDGEDNCWFAHEENPSIEYGSLLQKPFIQPKTEKGEPLPQVVSIVERRTGEIWCATEKAGVYIFNMAGKLLRSIPYQTTMGNTFNLRYALAVEASGRVWATNGKSLFELDDLSLKWKEHIFGKGNALRLGSKKEGGVYVSSMDRLYEVIPKGVQLDITPSNLFAGLTNFDGILTFFGGSGNAYSYADGKINARNPDILEKQFSLSAYAAPNAIFESPFQQRTWFGTTKGLAYWGWGNSGIKFIEKTGFDHAMITAITGDGVGKLWLGTYDGLYSYDPATGESHHFPVEEGLPSGNISLSASLTASDGKIWFGTANGPVLFDPAKMQPYPHGPRVHIETFEINNQPYQGVPVVSEATRIELPYFENNLAFGLKAVGFYLPKLSTIHYRLTNLNGEWLELENGGTVRYPKLPPGEYRLEAYAVNANGVKGEARYLSIHIQPPWWQRWWFKQLVALFLAGIAYMSFRLYVRRKLMEQQRIFERQKALQDERNRIAAELHDDLGAGLSIIRFLSDHSLQQPQSGDQRQNINRIYQSAGELLEKMGDIIWAMNAENDNLSNLSAYLQGYAYEYLDVNGIQCSFQLPETIPAIELSGAQRRNLLLAFKESLHNVVKHAGATAVVIRLQTVSVHIILSVHDNGRGIDFGKLRAGGNGVRNIVKRMEAIGGSAEFRVEAGTLVLLKMPVGL